MSNVYHNTTKLTDKELAEAIQKASNQQEVIHELFKKYPEPKTPFEVAVLLLKNGFKYPITSVRARMTVLTKQGLLCMSAKADAKGEYDAKNHTWRLKGYINE